MLIEYRLQEPYFQYLTEVCLMGRASRKKKEKKQILKQGKYPKITMLSHPDQLRARGIIIPQGIEPVPLQKNAKIYRFFDTAEYADKFAAGSIRLSTLKMCRKYEDPLKGDPEEAVHRYSAGDVTNVNGENARKILGQLGFFADGEIKDLWVRNGDITFKIDDAYLLCTTNFLDPDVFKDSFGEYCVEISDPDEFFQALTNEIEKSVKLKDSKFGLINYAERFTRGIDNDPGRIGFVKPLKYADQKEVRFLWEPRAKTELDYLFLNVPQCVKYCTRIL